MVPVPCICYGFKLYFWSSTTSQSELCFWSTYFHFSKLIKRCEIYCRYGVSILFHGDRHMVTPGYREINWTRSKTPNFSSQRKDASTCCCQWISTCACVWQAQSCTFSSKCFSSWGILICSNGLCWHTLNAETAYFWKSHSRILLTFAAGIEAWLVNEVLYWIIFDWTHIKAKEGGRGPSFFFSIMTFIWKLNVLTISYSLQKKK